MKKLIYVCCLAVVFSFFSTGCSSKNTTTVANGASNVTVPSVQATELLNSSETTEEVPAENQSENADTSWTEDSGNVVIKQDTYSYKNESFDLTLEENESGEQTLVMYYSVGDCDSETGYTRISAIHGQLETICDDYIIPCVIWVDGTIDRNQILVTTLVRDDGIFTTGTEKDGEVSTDKLLHGSGYPDWYEFDVQNNESVDDFDEISQFLTKSLDSFCQEDESEGEGKPSETTE